MYPPSQDVFDCEYKDHGTILLKNNLAIYGENNLAVRYCLKSKLILLMVLIIIL